MYLYVYNALQVYVEEVRLVRRLWPAR